MGNKCLRLVGKAVNKLLAYGNLEIKRKGKKKKKIMFKKVDRISEAVDSIPRDPRKVKKTACLSPDLPIDKFILQAEKYNIGFKSSLMEYCALKKGLKVKRLTHRIIILEDSAGKMFSFHNMNGLSSSRVGKKICDNKVLARKLLISKELSVPKSRDFSIFNYDGALEYFKTMKRAVVKPTTFARSKGVSTNITSEDQFMKAWDRAASLYKYRTGCSLLIEEHIWGEDYRAFVVGNKVVSFTHRRRASVLGDGKSTISELIVSKNLLREKNPFLRKGLIPLDIKKLDRLSYAKLDLSYVPEKGERVTLIGRCNLYAGGDSIDLTDTVHPSFLEIAVRAVEAIPGVHYAGVDIITRDPTLEATEDNHVITEVEYSPAPISHFPFEGKPRDMASSILDFYLNGKRIG